MAMKRTVLVGLFIMFLFPSWLAAQQARLAARVEIAPDSRQPDIEAVAGDTIAFTLTARDDNGAVVDDWSTTGTAISILLENTVANVDTSLESWTFSDTLGYSFARIAAPAVQISANEWSIPPALFTNGVAVIRFVDTRAERGVALRVAPGMDTVLQVSARMNFREGPVARFFVDITPQTAVPTQVHLLRHYEVVVIARDRFQNDVPDPVTTVFSARFPGEFDNSDPDVMRMFGIESSVAGPTSFLIMSRIPRVAATDNLQYIIAGLKSNPAVRGRSDPYEILPHPPVPFALESPHDHSIIAFQPGMDSLRLAWIRPTPPDPFTNIQISRYNPVIQSDTVRYTALLLDSASLSNEARIPADMDATGGTLTLSKEQVIALVEDVAKNTQVTAVNAVWCVEAGDGVSKTYSTPPNSDPLARPGYHIYLMKPTLASGRMQLAEPWSGPSLDTTAGVRLLFTLQVKDLQGMDITRWDSTGYPVDITLGSTANTDTSEQSWSADPDDYTFARMELVGSALQLSRTGPHAWSIPPAAFAQGSATVALTCNKAESGVTMTLSHGGRRNPWQAVSKPMNFSPRTTDAGRPPTAADAVLFQNYPNPVGLPFAGSGTVITFGLRKASNVTLKIHSLLGAELATLVDGELAPGEHRIPFDARRLPPGVYMYTLRAGGTVLSRMLTLLR
jgi:hypothetical protein